jgi:hypothetical protein
LWMVAFMGVSYPPRQDMGRGIGSARTTDTVRSSNGLTV